MARVTIDFKGRLNPEQYDAARHSEGPLLILAGAGSGKTQVLTHRIAHLIMEVGAAPESILAVTFTNKAAAEMWERVHSLHDEARAPLDPARSPSIGTFHRTCARLLRVYAAEIGLNPRFVIYDDGDQRAILKRTIAALDIDEAPKFVAQCAAAIDHFKNQGVEPPQAMEDAVGGEAEQIARVYAAYQRALHAAGCMDFGDLILQTVSLLRQKGSVRQHLWRRWHYLMVDEFQDTNTVQYELLRLLTDPERRNLAVVGDDDQSIYGWRGATVRNILDFGRDHEDAHVVKLERNYRSTQLILDASNAVIVHVAERTDKRLWTDQRGGEPIAVFTGRDAREEASWIARALQRLTGVEGFESDQCAIFYRTNSQARLLEEQLRAAGLGYQMVGGVSFYDRAEVKDTLAFLKVALNTDDTINLLRIVNKPPRSLGSKTLEKLENLIVLGLGPTTIFEAMDYAIDHKLFTGRRAEHLAAFRGLIDRLRARIQNGDPPSEITEDLIEEIGFLPYLSRAHAMDAEERKDNVLDLIAAMQDFEAQSPGANLGDFLERCALNRGERQDGPGADSPLIAPVAMMTVHASKGLEFDAVFVTGLEDGLFPLTRPDSKEDDLDEERRLFYVAMTRARKRLLLTNARSRRAFGGAEDRETRPSRFLADIPPHLMRVVPESAEKLVIWKEPHAAQALQSWGHADFDFDQSPPTSTSRAKVRARRQIGRAHV